MKRLLPLAVLLAALVTIAGVYANQKTVSIAPGFFTGKDYLDMSDNERRAYATGAINGMLVAPFFGATDEGVSWLRNCTAKLSDEEIAAILTRHIREQNQPNYNLNVLSFNAMRAACPKNR